MTDWAAYDLTRDLTDRHGTPHRVVRTLSDGQPMLPKYATTAASPDAATNGAPSNATTGHSPKTRPGRTDMGRRASTREMKPILEWARQQGCETTLSNGHHRITWQGHLIGSIASTPSDPRAMLNAKAFIRRNLNRLQQEQDDTP